MTETPVKGVAIMWNPYVPTLVAATRKFPWLDLKRRETRTTGACWSFSRLNRGREDSPKPFLIVVPKIAA